MQWQQIPFEGNNCCASQADLVRGGTVWGVNRRKTASKNYIRHYVQKKKKSNITYLVNYDFSQKITRNYVGMLPQSQKHIF